MLPSPANGEPRREPGSFGTQDWRSASARWWPPMRLAIDIPAGQKISLIGANGAGKTTFVNMVTGYLKPDNGSILLDGIDIG